MSIDAVSGGVLGFRYKKIVDEALAPGTTYIGYAEPNTATSDEGWLIVRVTVLGTTTTTEYAGGTTLMNKVWDNRASYSYS